MYEESFERDLPKTILLVLRSLLQKGIFSPNTQNVVIERVGRDPVYPCGRYGLEGYDPNHGIEGLDLSQLEWASREGRFWFSGPFRDLRIIVDKGPIQGDLQLETKRMIFTTSLNKLSYTDFETFVRKLREVAQQQELELEFQSLGNLDVKLTISTRALLSVDNVDGFIDKVRYLHASSDVR